MTLHCALALGSAEAAAQAGFSPPAPSSTVIFGSIEAGPAKAFASSGFKRAFGADGLDASGFRLMASLGGSREHFGGPAARVEAHKAEATTLIGYDWHRDGTVLGLYLGRDDALDVHDTRLGRLVSHRGGFRIQGEIWSRPLPDLVVQATAYASSLDGRRWLRLGPGWTLWAPVAIGPEIELYREGRYRKSRIGLQLLEMPLFGLVWRLSAGIQRESGRRGGAPYAILGAYWRR